MKSYLSVSIDTELLVACKKKAGLGNFSKTVESLLREWIKNT